VTALSAEPPPAAGRQGLPPSMVERMTLIMDAFAGVRTQLSLEEVARATRLPRSTAHRILDQLVRLDWLCHSAAGYRLGRRALELGGGDGGHGRIREAAAPLLHDLQLRTGLVVHLAVLAGPDVLYLDKAGGRAALTVPTRVGGRVPAHATAPGKAILAWLAPEQAEAVSGAGLTRLTSSTITGMGALHRELGQVRQHRGLAFEHGECFPGVCAVAAAVRGPDGPVAAIGLAARDRAPLERAAPLVAAAARQVSSAVFPAAFPAARRLAALGRSGWR
jgi:DNA-binding IclR family transcriptional regulator